MMKRILSRIAIGLTSTSIFALNPTPGLYGGIIVGGSYAPSITSPAIDWLFYNYFPNAGFNGYNINNLKASLNYSFLGLIGAQLGYRFDKIRLEGEFFYNSNPYSSITVTNNNQTIFTISGNSNELSGNYIEGQTNTAAGMINLYYDLLPPDYIDASFAPFLGVGVGYASVQNGLDVFIAGTQANQNTIGKTHNNIAGQAMAGVLLFLDDFSYFTLDFRYFTTGTQSQYVNIVDTTYTWKNQLVSVNLSFNGHINLG